ncbi:MAG: hypothetical protein JO104_06245 [Candidatus Eremiobacteraeota bacterium]|nr:hypothetical protein [Candidatus Eremiobacteraeota bacterium]
MQVLLSVLLTSCGGSGVASPPAVPVAAADWSPSAVAAPDLMHVNAYWTLFASAGYPQVEIARVPMTAKSKFVNIGATNGNNLLYTSAIAYHNKQLWILSFGKHSGDPDTLVVFDLPLKAASLPRHQFVLSGSDGGDAVAFDAKGNLWLSSATNHEVLRYNGPFTKNRTLKPSVTINGGSLYAYAIAVDKVNNVYVSLFNGGSEIDCRLEAAVQEEAVFSDRP